MNLSSGSIAKPMSLPSSSASWKSGDGVSDQFPAGLRVLVVDDDRICLRILEKTLMNCHYEVTTCNRAEVALSLLRENKNGFDVVISDVHMPDMDGFKLLEHIGLEMDLPVIMMSADDSKSVVMKGVTHGACDYLIKPVRIEALKNIWQHVVRKKKYEVKDKDFEQSGSVEDGERQQKPPEDVDYSSSANEGNWKNSKKRKEEDEEGEEREESSSSKKPRVVWSVELHQQFVQAVNQLGIDKAVPKKILELMNVPGITRENVASHLQKYRLYLRRLSGVSQHQSGLNNTFMGHPDATFGTMSSLNGLDLQALAASGQLPAQSLATFQAAALGRSTKSAIPMPLAAQSNLFSFDNSKLRFPEGQQQLNNSNKQINFLHGIPTTMAPKQLANLHHPSQSFTGMNMQMNSTAQQNNSLFMHRPQILNGANNSSQLSRLPLSMQQPFSSGGLTGPVLAQGGIVDNARGSVYNPVPQASSMVDFSLNQNMASQSYDFPLMSNNSGMSSSTRRGVLQVEVNSDIKGSRGIPPGYDIFNDPHQQKSQDWSLQNLGSTFDASHRSSMQGTLDVPPYKSVQNRNAPTGNPVFSNGEESVRANTMGGPQLNSLSGNIQNRNTPIGNSVFSNGEESVRVNTMGGPQLNSLGGNMHAVKTESFHDANCQSTYFADQFEQDDLMSALLKQQDNVEPVENEFGFDGYPPLDDLPV